MPIQVSIEPTNICNFRCRFCNQSSPNHFSKRPAGMIDLTDYELLLHKIRKTCKSVKTLSLTLDGEPLLHKHLPQMIKKANEMSFFVRFSSNGYKINKHFRLEIYENSGYYEKLNKVQSNLKILKEHFGKMPRLTYGLRSYHKIVNGRTLDFSNSKYYGCLYPWTSLNITWNGDVVTCCRDLDGEYVLGNILKSSIEDVWNGQKYLYLREAILKNNLRMIASCRSCDLPYDRQRNRWRYKMQKALQKW